MSEIKLYSQLLYIALFISVAALVGCGQAGDLYLPDAPKMAQKSVKSTIKPLQIKPLQINPMQIKSQQNAVLNNDMTKYSKKNQEIKR